MAQDAADRSQAEIRNELLESAGKLLHEKGLDGFSLNKVTEAADTSKQMIYTIFGSRADLIKAVYDEKIADFAEYLEDVEGEDPVETLLKYSLAYRDWILDNKYLFDLMLSLNFHEQFQGRDSRVVERNEIFDHYDAAVREAQELGIIESDVEVESLVDSFWAAANGCLRLEVVDYYPDEETAKQHFVDTTAGVFWGRGTVLPELRDDADQGTA